MATANFNIQPEDGWVAVTAADVKFIKIAQYPRTQPFYVTLAASPPAKTVRGYLVDKCEDFWVDVPSGTERYYVRTTNSKPDIDLRIDVLTVATA